MLKNKFLLALLLKALIFMVLMTLFNYITIYKNDLERALLQAAGAGVFYAITLYFFERKHWKA